MPEELFTGPSRSGSPVHDVTGEVLDLRQPVHKPAALEASPLRPVTGAGGATAFVFGGGGSLGAVQVGMLRALLELGIRPDFVVGTSIGSLNGAYLAGHLDLDGVESLAELWSSVRRADVFRINVRSLLGAVMGRRDHLFEVLGLRAVIERAGLGFARLEDAPIPVHAVATDLLSARPVVISEGDTVDALLASSAIPGIFPPVNVGGRLLVDGGVLANLPVTQAIELGATRVFVLPAMPGESAGAPGGALDLMQRSMLVATTALTRGDLVRVDDSVEVHMLPVPVTAQGSIFDFGGTRRAHRRCLSVQLGLAGGSRRVRARLMSVTVVTDSAASLPAGAVEDLGIVVVPMTLVLGGLVYADGDLSPDELVERATQETVTTSSPSPGDFLKAVARSSKPKGPEAEFLVLTVSSAMSATYEVARTAASYLDDVEARVIDTGTAAGAQGLVVLAAAELAATGASLDEVAASG